LIGVSLGVNLFNAAVLGALGVPGLALLMMTQWIFR
jgi:inhibitor of the pro-sigma K processing machinery